MKSYTRVYLDYFGYSENDYIMCEYCNRAKAVDIHHIYSRKRRPDLVNNIENLMALCRECHTSYGDNNNYLNSLIDKHKEKISELPLP